MKAVVFDMDGVLFDTERLAIKCWDEIGVRCGLGPVGYMVFKTLGRTTEESVKIFSNEFGTAFDNGRFQTEYKAWLDQYYAEHPVPVKTGVREILKMLKENGFKTAVASSSSKKSVYHHLNSTGLTPYFNAVICGDMIQKSKPEPDIYIAACHMIDEQPESCYAVEDSKSGLLAARAAGCRVVFIPDIYTPDAAAKAAYDLQFQSMKEFQNYITKTE